MIDPTLILLVHLNIVTEDNLNKVSQRRLEQPGHITSDPSDTTPPPPEARYVTVIYSENTR